MKFFRFQQTAYVYFNVEAEDADDAIEKAREVVAWLSSDTHSLAALFAGWEVTPEMELAADIELEVDQDDENIVLL